MEIVRKTDSCSTTDQDVLGIEIVEDIIDVENEMGFGEGEDWGQCHEENVAYSSKQSGPRRNSCRSGSSPTCNQQNSCDNEWEQQGDCSPDGEDIMQSQCNVSASLDCDTFRPMRSIESDVSPRRRCKDSLYRRKRREKKCRDSDDESERDHCSEAEQELNHFSQTLNKRQSNKHDSRSDPCHGSRSDASHGNRSDPCHSSRHDASHGNRQDPCHVSKPDPCHGNRSDPTHGNSSDPCHGNRSDTIELMEQDDDLDDCGTPRQKDDCEASPARNPCSANRVRFSLDLENAERVMGCVKKEKCKEMPAWRHGGASASTECHTERGTKGSNVHRRKEPNVRDSLKDLDLDKCYEPKEDKKAMKLANEKIERLEDAISRQQEIVANMKSILCHEGIRDYSKLRQLVDALDKNLKKVNTMKTRRSCETTAQAKGRTEDFERLKNQCSQLECERDKMKKKMKHLVENSKRKEKELEEVAIEREKVLECKVKELQCCLQEWQSKFRKLETEICKERNKWEENLSCCKLDWQNKKEKWAIKLKERESELCSMKSSQDRLTEVLLSCCQSVRKLKRVAMCNKHESKSQGTSRRTDSDEDDYHDSNIDHNNCGSLPELARSIMCDVECIERLLEDSSGQMQAKYKHQTEYLKEQNQMLENKICQTLQLMDELQQCMKVKEDQISKENENYARLVEDKVRQVEDLENQFAEKEKDMDCFIQDLKDEICHVNKQLERERCEKTRLLTIQGDVKQKLMKGLQKREHQREEEMSMLKVQIDEMTNALCLKDKKIERLEDEVKEKCSLLVKEKEKWNMAIKEVKQKAARTILRFAHGKENGLLEHLRDRRKAHKSAAEECHSNRCDDEEEINPCRHSENLSLRDRFGESRHRMKTRSIDIESPRESHHSYRHQPECEKTCVHEDMDKIYDSHKTKVKLDRELMRKKERSHGAGCCSSEDLRSETYRMTSKSSRSCEKQDCSKKMDRRRDSTLSLLQGVFDDI